MSTPISISDSLSPETANAGLLTKVKTFAPHIVAGIASLVFLDSLRFKFTNAPETQTIFGKLNDWAASFGADGLFAQTGLFSQYVIGTAELFASALLVALVSLNIMGSMSSKNDHW